MPIAFRSQQWLLVSVAWGMVVWLASIALGVDDSYFFQEIEILLLFGIAVIAPISMHVCLKTDQQQYPLPTITLAAAIHPIVVIGCALAISQTRGLSSAILASIWLVQTALIASYGMYRLWMRFKKVRSLYPLVSEYIDELCIDAGLVYLPISGVWFVAYAGGIELMTFPLSIVALTAVHFAFIGPGALVISGMIGRRLRDTSVWRFYRWGALILVISPIVVANGITLTQFSDIIALEFISAIMLTTSLLFLGFLQITNSLPEERLPRTLLQLSLLTLIITMTLAIAYPTGRVTGLWSLSLETMVRWHGWFNAIGFVLLGLLGFMLATPHTSDSQKRI